MKNKIIYILLFLFLILSCYEIYDFFDKRSNEENKIKTLSKEIEKLDVKDYVNKKDISFTLTKEYLGYIEIEKLNIKKLISKGTTDDVLNKNVVGLHKFTKNIDSEFGNIVLAGHNNKYVFGSLLKINLNDEIILTTHKKNYKFKVTKKDIINENDFKYFKVYEKEKIITLITCYGKNKRFIVIGKEI